MSEDRLLEYLLSTNCPSSSLSFSSSFREWNAYVAENLRFRSSTLFACGDERESRYECGEDQRLLAFCRDHVRTYRRITSGDATLLFTHPLYLHLTHKGKLDTPHRRDEADD